MKNVCAIRVQEHLYEERERKILENFQYYNYPCLNENERHAIRVIASSLYVNIKTESDKSLELYKQLDEAFVKSD
ncbi:hypothetical protein [Vibrio sp. qd031]|uniref:hypothetical protein n=1 Tax=Vibrio sp. qd031 TaxID=1603038 RepID=UPI001F5BB219|nr:hypothetical protein [Vibrio sp. qd031]